jgi:hypothetical protein
MFISVKHLHENLGVNETIARFFVDRKVPENNVFWKEKLLYVGRGNGFVNIPVYYDILFRIGIPVEVLLEEEHIRRMERIMHFAIQVEREQISFAEQLEKISGLMQDSIQHIGFYEELMRYLMQEKIRPMGRLGIQPPALSRADVFLFILCDLPITDDQLSSALRYWYALHPTYLLMDDICDYKKDKENNEENAVMELGEGGIGFEKAFEIIERNILELETINPSLANSMQSQLASLHDLVV